MKYLLYSFLLFVFVTCKKTDTEINEPPTICISDSTTLQITVSDYYSRQPIGGTELKVIRGNSCGGCPLNDTFLTQTGNLLGELEAAFKHSKEAKYGAAIIPPDPYLPVNYFSVRAGCTGSYNIFLKPKIKLGIWIKNPTDRELPLKLIQIAQKPDPAATNFDSYDPGQNVYTVYQTPGYIFPPKSDWKVFWFDALPEQELEIWLDYGYSLSPTLDLQVFRTTAGSLFNCQIELKPSF